MKKKTQQILDIGIVCLGQGPCLDVTEIKYIMHKQIIYLTFRTIIIRKKKTVKKCFYKCSIGGCDVFEELFFFDVKVKFYFFNNG